jgi:hypothetical protein
MTGQHVPSVTQQEVVIRMFKLTRKRGVVIGAVAALAIAAAAYAYWTSTGSGTGSASAAGAQSALTVNQTTTLSAMYPGDSAQTISGTFNNPNSGPIFVHTVTASIASVTKASGAPAGSCDATDFTLSNATATVDAEIAIGNGKGSWTGPTLQFNDKTATNQDACKGATVSLSYAIG